MILFGLLPILGFVAIFRFIRSNNSIFSSFVRAAFIQSAIIWGLLIVLSTELLSLINAVAFIPLCLFWLLVIIIFHTSSRNAVEKSSVKNFWQKMGLLEKLICVSMAVIAILVGVAAFFGCPNSWDALIYHMSRIMFWQQNHTVAHYPTADYRQLYLQPFGEYAELHFQILTDSDRMAPMTSWFAYIGIAVGMSLAGALLNAGRLQQLLMALSVLTIPTAITEASGVRIDMIISFWAMSLLTMMLLSLKTGRMACIFGIGAALGLGMLTKGTMYLIAMPLLAWYAYESLQHFKWKKTVSAFFIIGIMALIINSGFYTRNLQLTGSFLGPSKLQHWVLCDGMTLPLVISNLLKNTLDQLGTPFHGLNMFIEHVFKNLHHWLHVDPLDARSNYNQTPFTVSVSTYEECVTNCLQVLLILIAGTGLLIHAFKTRRYDIIRLVFTIAAAFMIISSAMRWNQHMTRYLLPVLCMSVPMVFLWIGQERFPKWLVGLIVASLVLASVPYLLKNNLRRFIGKDKPTIFNTPRLERYFQNEPGLLEPYTQAIHEVVRQHCQEVGLFMEYNYWDYPFWLIMRQETRQPLRFEHLHTINVSPKKYPLGNFYPCAIIAVDKNDPQIQLGASTFIKIKDFGQTAVYINPAGRQKIEPLRF